MPIVSISFNNAAFKGPEIYMHIDTSCDETCLNARVVGLNITHNYPTLRLVLNDPAVYEHYKLLCK